MIIFHDHMSTTFVSRSVIKICYIHCIGFIVIMYTYSIQSTANTSPTSEVGRPIAVSTSRMVTRAAWGTLALPILAKVATKLKQKIHSK